ncbi:MAG: aminopeptidase [Solirubrobacterales bacterium]
MEKTREKNAWLRLAAKEGKDIDRIADGYVRFLNEVRTERQAVDYITSVAKSAKFVPLSAVKKLKAGDRVIWQEHGKISALCIIGKQPIEEGINLVASHADAPRVDLKPVPLYEDAGMALFKTHYYGGIKKYQWTAIPLALHGVVIKKDGTKVEIRIGDAPEDPVFTITDLLPHLAKDQMEKKMGEGVTGEGLNILVGSLPQPKGKKEEPGQQRIKAAIEELLKNKYGIEPEDFLSAELQGVPAIPAREIGFDRSLIGGFGQDDRVCVYTSLAAALEVKAPEKTAVCLFADKEEIGSVGNTGLESFVLEHLISDLLEKAGKTDFALVRRALRYAKALSADVNGAVDPNYEGVFEKMNSAFVGQGVCVTKYTGSRGKSGASEANAEFVAQIRRLFDDNDVPWQAGELGKVDQGGGGTVSMFLARYGMEVLDCGVALLGMHSPFEVTAKSDIYATYKAYKVFMQSFA